MISDDFNYREFYKSAASTMQYTRYVEVGVYTGASLSFLAGELRASGRSFELYGVDLWEDVNKQTNYDRWIDSSVWESLQRRLTANDLLSIVRLIRAESAKAAEQFANRSVDFVFIDANHDYEHVKADIRAWLPKVNSGGLICGHDYGEPCGVKQAVDEIFDHKISLWGTVWYKMILP